MQSKKSRKKSFDKYLTCVLMLCLTLYVFQYNLTLVLLANNHHPVCRTPTEWQWHPGLSLSLAQVTTCNRHGFDFPCDTSSIYNAYDSFTVRCYKVKLLTLSTSARTLYHNSTLHSCISSMVLAVCIYRCLPESNERVHVLFLPFLSYTSMSVCSNDVCLVSLQKPVQSCATRGVPVESATAATTIPTSRPASMCLLLDDVCKTKQPYTELVPAAEKYLVVVGRHM